MITGYYAEKNELKSDGIEIFQRKLPCIWIDCLNPSKKELKDISENTGITVEDLVQGVDEDERPRINLSDRYTQFIFSTPIHTHKGIETVSFSVFLFNDKLITLRKNELDVISNILLLPEQKKVEILTNNPNQFLFILLQDIITEYFRVTDPIEEVIEKIDTHLFHNFDTKKILKQIFDVRKMLIFFHKALVANREVLSGLEAQYPPQIKKSDVKKFRFLHNDVTQLIDMITTYREILTGSLDVYMTTVSNNLNLVMKRLTVYASYILVPTLITGVYGMNFRFLPETTWKYGYFFALGLMVFSIIVMHLLFKKKNWI